MTAQTRDNSRSRIHVRSSQLFGATKDDDVVRRLLALRDRDDIDWLAVNAVLGSVVIAPNGAFVDEGGVRREVRGILDADRGSRSLRVSDLHAAEHPADVGAQRRALIELVVDGIALGLSRARRLAPLAPFPLELAAIVGFVDADPRARRALARVIGAGPTDLGLAVVNATLQGLTQGSLGLIVDAAQRFNLLTEARSRARAWDALQARLSRSPALASGVLPHIEPRPRSLPDGPIERYAQIGLVGGVAVSGLALLRGRGAASASAAAVASVPKAGRLGREAFAGQLARVLERRDALVLNPESLRRLDRVDTIIFDESCIGALHESSMSALVGAARDANLRVVLPRDHALDSADARFEASSTLDEVRSRQADGSVVAVVSAEADAVLLAADVGVGVAAGSDHVPWTADVLCEPFPDDIALVIAACSAARDVSRQSVFFAAGGSALGALATLFPLTPRPETFAAGAINVAALGAMGFGTWTAFRLGQRPRRPPVDDHEWHALPAGAVLERLGTGSDGLTSTEAQRRRAVAREQFSEPTAPSFLENALEELANPLTPILAAGASLSAMVESQIDAVLVGAVTGMNAVVGAIQRRQTERALDALKQQTSDPIAVVRDGAALEVAATDLVPGDVLALAPGDAIPVDARLLDTNALQVDEATLTGESLPVDKNADATPDTPLPERHSMVYAGTDVVAGSGYGVVVATGSATEAGRIAREVAEGHTAPGVEARLAELTRQIVPVVLGAGAGVIGVGLVRGSPLRKLLPAGAALAVAAVPEGLPFVATVAQLAAARRLSERGAIVRGPRTLEALGRVDVLCFDKTGTLTEGHVRLQAITHREGTERAASLSPAGRSVLAAALRATPPWNGSMLPHPTDQAVLDAAKDAHLVDDGFERENELPFNPDRAFHAVWGDVGGNRRLSVKGAPEAILDRCSGWWRGRDGGGTVERDGWRQRADEIADSLANDGYRVLAVATRAEPENATQRHEGDVRDLGLLGFLAFGDQVRDAARAAVQRVQRAGVAVTMITGDHPGTARVVASDLGILDGGRVVTGTDLERWSDDELDALVADVRVFARVTPRHKTQIVASLQRAGRVVAMTGDGANDAPAIRLSDTGIALGQHGTAAAREAADVVVTDDALETIVQALVEGRAIWHSVRDAIAVLLGGNLGEVAYMFGGTAMAGQPPLNARQLLLTNLLTDLLPALAIAVQRPQRTTPEELLAGGPDVALGGGLTAEIAVRGAATAFAASSGYLAARFTGRPARARTVGLVALIGAQLGQTITAGIRDPLTLVGSALSTAALVATVQTPGVSQFFGCTPIGPVGWAFGVGAATIGTVAAHVSSPVARRLLQPSVGHDPAPTASGERDLESAADLSQQRRDRDGQQLGNHEGEELFHVDNRPDHAAPTTRTLREPREGMADFRQRPAER